MPIRFTRFGTFYILFSLAVGAAAINTGNNLLYLILGLLLGFIIISGFLSDSCLWGLDIEFEPVGDFYAGQPAEWDMVARKSWFPAIIVRIEAFWTTLTSRVLLYWVPRYGSYRLRVSATPERRGLFTLKSLRLSTRFPFGLFEKSHQETFDQSWVVFPRLKTLPLRTLQAAGLNISDQPAGRKGLGATPFDLREYQVGDSSKKIHWKSSAKRGRLMVTDMEEESAAGQTICIPHWPAASECEAFISFVASLAYTLYRYDQPIGFQGPGLQCEADRSRTQLKKVLTYLALVDPAQESRLGAKPRSRYGQIDALSLWRRVALP